ncbi:MAG: DUF3822 family protein [Ferruginibacter sp.]|nr:DUF3822 family protein [Ferruginibacter sp.]
MNPSFYINTFLPNEHAQLLLEVGENNVALAILQDKKFTALANYNFTQVEDLSSILNTETLLQHTFSKIDIVYSNKHCVLVPPACYNTSSMQPNLELLFGDVIQEPIKSDFLFRHNIHTVYYVDNAILNCISAKFPFANTHHIYSLLPDVTGLKGNKLYTIFYPNKCVILCCKENNLQLIQQFEYTTPEDVAYHLLSIANNHNMQMDELMLTVGGMIDKTSSLYNELYKYFRHIVFDSLNNNFEYCEDIKQLPTHYFSPLLSIASCV